MTLIHSPTSRRNVLKAFGVGTVGVLFAGNASGATGRYVVGTTSIRGARAATAAADTVHRVLDFGSVGQAVAGTFSPAALRGLAARPDVRYVEVDGLLHAISIDDADSETDWGVDRVDAEKAWSTKTGASTHVAILDTGIDYDHPDLADAMSTDSIAFAIRSPNKTSSTDPADYDDGNGHGTHCAGIAAAVRNGAGVVGVGQGAILHAVKVLHDNGSGSYSDVAAGIKWVGDRKAATDGWDTAIASMSLGGPLSDTIKDACTYAYGKGVLLVAAAGNDGEDVAGSAPAAYDTVVAVSATDRTDATPSWSNYGEKIELAAPGVSIYSTYKGGGYATYSGTSMACPHVSGGAALAWATLGTTASNVDVRSHLQTTAEDLGASGRDTTYGYGLLDAEKVVTGSSSGGSSDTTAPSAPTNLASPAHTDTTVDLTWDASTDDVGVAGYNVYVDGVKWGSSADTAETVTGLTAGTTYGFHVTAYDAAGNESGASNSVSVTTDASSGGALAIATFTATSLSPNNPHVEVSMDWESTGATSATLTLKSDDATIDESWTVATTGSKYFEKKHASTKALTATLTVSDGTNTVSEVRTFTA